MERRAGFGLKAGHCLTEPIAQAVHCGGIRGELTVPGFIEPLYPGVEALGPLCQLQQIGGQLGKRRGLRLGRRRRQPAVAAQLELRKLPGEIGPMVQQPGDPVHHSRCRAQGLAGQRE